MVATAGGLAAVGRTRIVVVAGGLIDHTHANIVRAHVAASAGAPVITRPRMGSIDAAETFTRVGRALLAVVAVDWRVSALVSRYASILGAGVSVVARRELTLTFPELTCVSDGFRVPVVANSREEIAEVAARDRTALVQGARVLVVAQEGEPRLALTTRALIVFGTRIAVLAQQRVWHVAALPARRVATVGSARVLVVTVDASLELAAVHRLARVRSARVVVVARQRVQAGRASLRGADVADRTGIAVITRSLCGVRDAPNAWLAVRVQALLIVRTKNSTASAVAIFATTIDVCTGVAVITRLVGGGTRASHLVHDEARVWKAFATLSRCEALGLTLILVDFIILVGIAADKNDSVAAEDDVTACAANVTSLDIPAGCWRLRLIFVATANDDEPEQHGRKAAERRSEI